MAPWAGRLADGRFRAEDGRLVQVPRTHGRHAIHGLLWDRPWTIDGADPDRAVLSAELPAHLWPPGGTVRHEVRLGRCTPRGGHGQRGELRVERRCPRQLGWHPWFRRVGEVSLRVDADAVLETAAMIPTGRAVPVDGRTDLRNGPRLGRRRLDHAYVAAGAPAVLRWPDLELAIAWEPTPATLVVYTPASSLCVEPQTAWPNAPALEGDARARSGLQILRPGESLTASMSMTVRRLG